MMLLYNKKTSCLLVFITILLIMMGFYIFSTGNNSPNYIIRTGSRIYSVEFSPNGQFLLVGGENGLLQIYDAETGELIQKYQGQTSAIFAVSFSPDGRYIATAGSDGVFRLWDTSNNEQLEPISVVPLLSENGVATLGENHALSNPLFDVTFSSDGEIAAVSGSNGRIYLIQVENGQIRHALQGHYEINFHERVKGVTFNDDNSILMSFGNDGVVHLWQVRDGTFLGAIGSAPVTNAIVSISLPLLCHLVARVVYCELW